MLDKNEAPEGFEAVEYNFETGDHHCSRCALAWIDSGLTDLCFTSHCHRGSRKDRTTVYFVRRSPNMSTFLHPMGSLGEDV